MGTYYYFYKSDNIKESFKDAKFAGIPNNLLGKYGLEMKNHILENCLRRKDDRTSCLHCDCTDENRYKITREKSKVISKDMDSNQTLFDDLMDSIKQDFLWVRLDY